MLSSITGCFGLSTLVAKRANLIGNPTQFNVIDRTHVDSIGGQHVSPADCATTLRLPGIAGVPQGMNGDDVISSYTHISVDRHTQQREAVRAAAWSALQLPRPNARPLKHFKRAR